MVIDNERETIMDTTTKLFFAGFVAVILFVGYLNWADIEDCKNLGHSEEYCLTIYNP